MIHTPSRILCKLIFLAVLLLTACNAGPTPKATITPTASQTSTHTLTPTISQTPTITLTPTNTVRPTRTHKPTATPRPTLTPKQTLTPRPTFPPASTPTQDISPAKSFAILGKGLANDVMRSPDGSMIALLEGAWGNAPRLQWFDTATNEQLGSVQLTGGTGIDGFSTDNRWILVPNYLGVNVVNTETGSFDVCCGAGNGSGFGYRFSADNHYIAYTGADRTTGGPYHFVGVFPLDPTYDFTIPSPTPANEDEWRGQQTYPILHPDNYHLMSAPAISPDSRWLAAGYRDTGNNILYLWGLKTGVVQFAIPHIAEINSVDFSPDSRYLASAGDDGVLRLFSASTGQLERAAAGFTGFLRQIRFTPDGRQITVSDSIQGDLTYDITTGKIERLATPEPTPDPFLAAMHQQGYADGDGVLFSPDGKTLAIGGQSVQLWDVAGQSVKLSIENPYSGLLSWAFNADGSYLGGVTEHGDVLVWNTTSGELLLRQSADLLPIGQVYYASGGGLGMGIGAGVFTNQGIAFSPDGTQIAFGDGNGIEIWEVASASLVRRLEQPAAPAYATRVSFSADGRRLYAIINRNRDAQIWDAASGTLIKELDLPTVEPNAFTATALNGPYFARNNHAGGSYWVELWNLDTGTMFKLPVPDQTEPFIFSPDASLLIAISEGNLYFWKTATGELIDYMTLATSLPGLSISPENTTLAIGEEGKASLLDITAIQRAASQASVTPVAAPPTATPWSSYTQETPLPTQMVTFSEPSSLPEGAISPANLSQLAETAHFGRGVLSAITWSQAQGATLLTAGPLGVYGFGGSPLSEVSHIPTTTWMEALVSLPNGDILAAGVISQTVQAWNLSTNTLLAELSGFGPLQISSDGKLLVYGDDKGNLRSYDLATGQEIATLYTTYRASLPVISRDGRLVAAVDGWSNRLQTQNYVRIWDAQTGKVVNSVGGPDTAITDLSFSVDGQFLVGAAGGSAWVWDIRPEVSRPYRLELYPSELNGNLVLYHQRVTAAAISPDNRLLAVGDSERNIWLYEIATNKLIHQLTGHAAPLYRLRFSADGTSLLSADADGRIMTWNVSSGAAIASLDAHTGAIRDLITGLDGNLRTWAANTSWILDPNDGALLHTTSVYSGTILAANPAGDWLAVTNRLQMSLWDANTGEFGQILEGIAEEPFIDHMYEGLVLRGYYEAEFSLDGTQLTSRATGMLDHIYVQQADNTFQYQGESDSGNPVWQMLQKQIERTATATDGYLTATTQQEYEPAPFLILKNNTGSEINRLAFPENSRITALAFSPDARLIAVGMADGSITFVDVAAWQVIATLRDHAGPVNALLFSADGRMLISAGEDGIVRFWGITSR